MKVAIESWIVSANTGETDFPIQNLPYSVFHHGGGDRIGVAIGDQILDLCGCAQAGLLESVPEQTLDACIQSTLNPLMALGRRHWSLLRQRVTSLLQADGAESTTLRQRVEPLLLPMNTAAMRLPAVIGGYSDFYASLYHATNVGHLFRPDNPLLPNFKYVPIGYHGRSSSIVVSGSSIHRPQGQAKDPKSDVPRFGPTQRLDYEIEVGIFVGPGNPLSEPIPIDHAESHIFGLCLLNDWSARDVQAWESQPLGPFLSKSFATTISPWVVPLEALEPFRVPAFERPAGDPAPLPYLTSQRNVRRGGFDVTLEVYISTPRMRREGSDPARLSHGNLRNLYWTAAQLLAHHTSNGCNLQPGDLLGSGTVSGPSRDTRGCLLELTAGGAEPLHLPNGEQRTFLEDGDEIIMRGFCERKGHPRIGFGECRGTIGRPPARL
jgi:fumarylacetoacetase